jgi:hypothetical protein
MMRLSDAETSAYLLVVAGVIWLLMGIVGLRDAVRSSDDTV